MPPLFHLDMRLLLVEDDSMIGEARQLSRIADAIVIGVLPHKEFAEIGIGTGDYTITLSVEA